jgi:hypothetical protein
MIIPEELEEPVRWVAAQDALSEFQSYLAPPPQVPHLLLEESGNVPNWQKCRGVYLSYNDHDRLLYVGSTLDSFQNRKRDHDKIFTTHSFDLIAIPKDVLFLAPALEVFLRERLHPMLGSDGKYV